MSDEQTQQQADDPSNDQYWFDVGREDFLKQGDMYQVCGIWWPTTNAGQQRKSQGEMKYRRRIERKPEQPSKEQRSESTMWSKLNAAMKQDPEFAWTVHCNYAVQIMAEGIPHGTANRAAARIMQHFHKIDVTQNSHWNL